ncbi:MAG TPA: transglycosylase domain-containing protein, partial [Actinomycetota bacterium]|nr:transglycosylase domain-containing protein [Actinomycetota bacterium]
SRPQPSRPTRIAARGLGLVAVALVMVAMVAMSLAATVEGISIAVRRYTDIPVPKIPIGPQTTFVYDANGRLITGLHAEVNRVIVPMDEISKSLREAVIAVEDKDFYRHGGIDVSAIVRAAWENALNGQIEQGGSTITQQYVKNVFTGDERTLSRKIHEAVLAVKLEQEYSKNQILEKYLNTVYFGHGAYGAQAAAQTYFGVPAKDLGVGQSALLAGLIAAPGRWDPVRFPDQAKARRNLVLDRMVEQGYLSRDRAMRVARRPVRLPGLKHLGMPYPYFMQNIVNELVASDGYQRTFEGGLRVATTLDPEMQRAAEAAVAHFLPTPKDPSAALVAIDPSTGAIRALVGGRDFEKTKFNLATQAHRQTGSAAKTFTLAAAVEKGISLNTLWSGPSSVVIDDPRCMGPDPDNPGAEKPWEVHNYADEESGTFTLAQAITHSVNTIFAQVVVDVGPNRVRKVMRDLGVRSSKLQAVCSITLGSQAITPMEMTSAYATLAARGVYHAPVAIRSIKTSSGRVVQQASSRGERVMDQNDADVVTYALQGVIREGTGTAASLSPPAGGRQDRHRPELPGRLVLRLHAAAGHVRVGGLPQGRDPHGERRGIGPCVRWVHPGGDLARVHESGHGGRPHRAVPHAGSLRVRHGAEPRHHLRPAAAEAEAPGGWNGAVSLSLTFPVADLLRPPRTVPLKRLRPGSLPAPTRSSLFDCP